MRRKTRGAYLHDGVKGRVRSAEGLVANIYQAFGDDYDTNSAVIK